MRSYDLTPLYRTTVGFDRLSSLLDTVNRSDTNSNGYPPYNIESLDENQYQITMALAGYTEDELELVTEHQTLTVKGQKSDNDDKERNYLHRGIATRSFERRFQLADHVVVKGARLNNGLLQIDLAREIPEAMKPKTIQIETSKPNLIDVDKRDAA